MNKQALHLVKPTTNEMHVNAKWERLIGINIVAEEKDFFIANL